MDFNEVYNEYWTKVYRLSMGYVNDPDWAKDIAQDTFITIWQQLSSFRGEAAIGTWIFRIACNNCLRQLEKSKRTASRPLPVELEDQQEASVEGKVNFLYRCIAELEQTDRLIISLELENMKQAEIATILGISEGNVRVRIHRIKDKLAKKFKSYEL